MFFSSQTRIDTNTRDINFPQHSSNSWSTNTARGNREEGLNVRRTSKSVPVLSTNVVVGPLVEVRIGGVLGSTEEADLEVRPTVIAIDNFPAELPSRPIRVIRGQQKRREGRSTKLEIPKLEGMTKHKARRLAEQDGYREAVATHSEGLDAAGGLPWYPAEKHEARIPEARRNDEHESRSAVEQDCYREAAASHSEGLDAAGGLPWRRSTKLEIPKLEGMTKHE